MNKSEAMQHALGYAAGREDVSGVKTHNGRDTPDGSGFIRFAEAFAGAWDDYNNERRGMMTNARDAYDSWQRTNGRTIFDR